MSRDATAGSPANPVNDIAAGVILGPDVKLGRDIKIGAGAVVLGRVVIGDRCVVSAGCVLDPSAESPDSTLILEPDVHLHPGVIVAAGVTVARSATIHAGTIVRRPVPPHAIVSGNPAQIIGYSLSDGADAQAQTYVDSDKSIGTKQTSVRGVTLHHLPRVLDLRGNLTVGEFDRSIPFEPKRYFMVFGVPNAEIRGEHAHRTCKQFLICAKGTCHVVADDGKNRQEFILDDPATGLYLPAMTWGIQYKYSADAVLLVFASEYYDPAEYVREYAEFMSLSSRNHEA